MATMRSHYLAPASHETLAAAGPGVAEHQVDVVAGVLSEQLVAEPQHLRLVRDVTGVAGDPDAGRGLRLGQGHGLRHGVRVQVAGRHRAALRRQLTGKLAAHARATAGHYRELSCERIHSHDGYRWCHCGSTIQGARTSTSWSCADISLSHLLGTGRVLRPSAPRFGCPAGPRQGWNHPRQAGEPFRPGRR